jgi:beta-glucosidase
MNLIEKSARIAATEASAYGIHWTFAPMVTLAETQDGESNGRSR